MATSGNYEAAVKVESYGGWYVGVRWSRLSVDVGANKSRIRATCYIRTQGNGYTINSSQNKSVYVMINGTRYDSSVNIAIGGNTTKDLFTYDADVYHNADGTKSCHFEAGVNFTVSLSGWTPGWRSAGGTAQLDTIPRTSNATISTDWLHVNESVTIYTNRASTEFTHTIWEDFGLGWWNLTATGVTDSWSWTPGYDYASRFPNSTQMGGRFRVATFRGDTYIGEVILGCTMYIRDGECVPYFEGTPYYEIVNDSGNTMPSGHVVKTQNRVRVISNPRGSYGSTITSVSVNFWAQRTEWGTNVVSPYPIVSGNHGIPIIATDSRGRQVRHDLSLYIDDWFTPWTSIDRVFRCREDGTEDAQNGGYIKIHYRADAPTIGGSWTWHNVYAYYKEQGTSQWIEFDHMNNATSYDRYPFFTADVGKSYDIRVQIVVSDKWYTTESSIGTAFVPFSLRPEGKGVAYGKVAELDGYMDMALTPIIRPNTRNGAMDIEWVGCGKDKWNLRLFGHNHDISPGSHYYWGLFNASLGTYIFSYQFGDFKGQHNFNFHTQTKFYNHMNLMNGHFYLMGPVESEQQIRPDNSLGGNKVDIYAFWNAYEAGYYSAESSDYVWRCTKAGQLTLKAGYNTTSDAREKQDILYMNNPLTRILALSNDTQAPVFDFDYIHSLLKPSIFKMSKETSGNWHMGFIAQDIKKSLDEAGVVDNGIVTLSQFKVKESILDEEGNEIEPAEYEERYGVAYQEIIALNTYKIQKQQKEIESLQNEIAELKAQVAILVNNMNTIE